MRGVTVQKTGVYQPGGEAGDGGPGEHALAGAVAARCHRLQEVAHRLAGEGIGVEGVYVPVGAVFEPIEEAPQVAQIAVDRARCLARQHPVPVVFEQERGRDGGHFPNALPQTRVRTTMTGPIHQAGMWLAR